MENINTNDFVDELFQIDPNYNGEIKVLEEKYKCTICCYIEKHNALQYTYFYEVDFGLEDNFFVEIESGINRGTHLNNEEWGVDSKQNTKTIEVLKDIVLDMDYYKKGSFMAKKAQAVLDSNKGRLFDFHRKNNYDNYVTGGNSKMKIDHIVSQLHLDYIYEEKEVDCTFV